MENLDENKNSYSMMNFELKIAGRNPVNKIKKLQVNIKKNLYH